MRATRDGDRVTVELDTAEAGRLGVVLTEATLAHSRAEFYIRTGCSLPGVQALAAQLESVAARRSDGFEAPLAAGVETQENPRRPRPPAEPRPSA
jgi:hypothetical protein